MGNIFKRARDYLRFGKRMDEEGADGMDDINEDEMNLVRMYPYKRFGRRRMSNFLRFG